MKSFDLLREKIIENINVDDYKYMIWYIENVEKEISELEEIEFRYNDLCK